MVISDYDHKYLSAAISSWQLTLTIKHEYFMKLNED